MKKRLPSILRYIPMIIMMCVIFIYSNMPASESAEISDSLVERIIIIVEHISGKTIQYSTAEFMCYAIRKIAHFTEYTILSITACFAFIQSNAAKRKNYYLCWLISALYAASDEIHQMFVPGRSARLTDVVIDSAGALLGTFLYFIINRSIKKVSSKT